MREEELKDLMCQQREWFASGRTLPVRAREAALEILEKAIMDREDELCDALMQDLGKSRTESVMCEISLALGEIRWLKKHLNRLCAKRRVRTPLAQFPASSFRSPSPYGNVLIMSPWNYPVLLTLEPLADALAAGNTAVVKPSAYAPHVSQAVADLIGECFPKGHVAVVTGGREENQALLKEKFDKIFFTGSVAVGKVVMKSAAEHLTPVTLELGGKSPCIVDSTAKIRAAARKIVFGKLVNCGQTCVAPDYVLCDTRVHDALISALQKEIRKQYGEESLPREDWGKIVNEKHFDRILSLIDPVKTVCGGRWDREALQIEPTVLDNVSWDDPVMQEEIFGPVIPVLTYRDLEEALDTVESRPRPLALYCFTESREVKERVLSRCRFGGGCINDTLIHLATSEMPFGGVGESGMGSYHGEAGFEEFSHLRSIVDQKTWTDIPVRYRPYTEKKEKMIRKFLK